MTAVAGKLLHCANIAELLDPEAGPHVGRFEVVPELVGVFVEDDVELVADPALEVAGALSNTQSEPWHW